MSDLLPCPFCGGALVWSDTYGEYHHPIAKCILSGHKFKKGMIGQWNRRALPAVQPDPREAALRDIARQKKTDEMDTEYDVEYADFEGGYNAIIDVARVALRAVQPAHVNETPKSEHEKGDMLTPEPWNPATSPSMTDLMVDPDQMREDRDARSEIDREDGHE